VKRKSMCLETIDVDGVFCGDFCSLMEPMGCSGTFNTLGPCCRGQRLDTQLDTRTGKIKSLQSEKCQMSQSLYKQLKDVATKNNGARPSSGRK
jgi:hypothetical protein